jgi:hypothetical protein
MLKIYKIQQFTLTCQSLISSSKLQSFEKRQNLCITDPATENLVSYKYPPSMTFCNLIITTKVRGGSKNYEEAPTTVP